MPADIDPIHYRSSYKLAADQIRRAIELGTYVPGDRLPASRELAFQLGISVATLREAVRGLIDQGLLEMRRGPKGGLVVLPQPHRRRISRAVMTELEKVLELRKAVESDAAWLAAERRTESDLTELQQIFETMVAEIERPEDGLRAARFIRADSQFHVAIARATQNELFVAVVEDTRARMFMATGGTLLPLTLDANEGHEEILRAIRLRHPEAAAKAIRQHIDISRDDALRAVGLRR